MEPQIVRGESYRRDVKAEFRRSSDDKKTVVIINTADLDAHRTIVEPSGAKLERYQDNPIVLINHDIDRVAGNSTVSMRNGQLVAEMSDDQWDLEDPEIARWFNKVKKGFVRSASIGFRVFDYNEEVQNQGTAEETTVWRITDWELMEWSFVSVPSNAKANVVERQVAEDLIRSVREMVANVKTEIETLKQSVAEQRQEKPSTEPQEQPIVAQAPSVEKTESTVPVTATEQTKTTESTKLDVMELVKALTPIVRSEVRKSLGKE